MLHILRSEWKRCIEGKEFQVTSLLIFLISIAAFMIDAFYHYGSGANGLRSAAEMSIVQSVYSSFLLNIVVATLPLFAALIYSDAFIRDLTNKVYPFTLTRIAVHRIVIAQCIVIFSTTFTVYMVCFTINQVLTLIAFPIEGVSNNFGFPTYDLAFQNYGPEFAFDLLRIQSPYLYNFLYMFIISGFAGLFALFTYAVLLFLKKWKLRVIIGVFLGFTVLNIVLSMADLRHLRLTTLLHPVSIYPEYVIIYWAGCLIMMSGILIYLGLKKKDFS
ncbi:hypothetical protein [Caldalkalibacillus salinus]|uniref:hypothetical protein n=1 Tax=Caldalkalibacillus salinus TaxID=2803787 RepID=UPI001921331B|nr:hypothetical protein [Caldalkalibacillus salinus]